MGGSGICLRLECYAVSSDLRKNIELLVNFGSLVYIFKLYLLAGRLLLFLYCFQYQTMTYSLLFYFDHLWYFISSLVYSRL